MLLVSFRRTVELKAFDGAALQGHSIYEVDDVQLHSHADFNLNCCVGNDFLSVKYKFFKVHSNCCS